ncbi:MAG: InlB B-repeat-containing protein, partial [Spirochaetaceae bacterium]|nr:InlB B-repeat-containing protein [Spirochaetaceae bacterium]
NQAVPGLAPEDISLEALTEGGSFVKGDAVSPGETGVYTIEISGIEAVEESIEVKVTLSKTAYSFSPATLDVTVYKRFSAITYDANGGTNNPLTTPAAVAQTIATANTFTAPSGKTFMEWNTAGDASGTRYLPGDVYTGSADLTLYAIWGGPVSGQLTNADLMVKFGIMPSGYSPASLTQAHVTAVFNAVQSYIRYGTLSVANPSTVNMKLGEIKINDWVMLPSFSVPEAVYNEMGSRVPSVSNQKVKVVGINPYAGGKNGNEAGAHHLVFQFENAVTQRRMNATDTNTGGYANTEIRKYLTPVAGVNGSGIFYNALVAAGVPESVFWSVKRVIGAPQGGSANQLSDKVFLPTVWEVSGGVNTWNVNGAVSGESDGNQGRLWAYGTGADNANSGRNKSEDWWSASPNNGSTTVFCCVFSSGKVGGATAGSAKGVVPAFCIK